MLPTLDILVPLIQLAAKECFEQSCELERTFKDDGSFVTQIDENLQREIHAKLKKAYPAYTLLGEEMTREEQLDLLDGSESGLWILDPIDGTTNFSTGFPIYGVSLAFVQQGVTHIAVVYDPVREETFTAILGEGAWLNGSRLVGSSVTELSDCIANVDYKRLTGDMASQLVICPPYRSQRNLGSSVIEWCWLAANRFQVYLHGGQQLWDYAAAQLILVEAGGQASGIDGAKIKVDRLTKQSVVAAASPQLYEQWFSWVKRQTQDASY